MAHVAENRRKRGVSRRCSLIMCVSAHSDKFSRMIFATLYGGPNGLIHIIQVVTNTKREVVPWRSEFDLTLM